MAYVESAVDSAIRHAIERNQVRPQLVAFVDGSRNILWHDSVNICFRESDLDMDGLVDKREVANMIRRLWPRIIEPLRSIRVRVPLPSDAKIWRVLKDVDPAPRASTMTAAGYAVFCQQLLLYLAITRGRGRNALLTFGALLGTAGIFWLKQATDDMPRARGRRPEKYPWAAGPLVGAFGTWLLATGGSAMLGGDRGRYSEPYEYKAHASMYLSGRPANTY